MEWEQIDTVTSRAKVFGGWMVRISEPVTHHTPNGLQDGWDWRTSLCFIPDPNHEWKLEEK